MQLNIPNAFATFPTLNTKRFQLREPILADAPTIFRIKSDPQVMRYFGSLPMKEESEAVELVKDHQQGFQQQQRIRWAIVPHGATSMIGSCGFWRIEQAHARAEIGYELAPEWWGQGVMPEALYAILRFGFDLIGLHSVEAQIDPANTGSRRVLEKLGFRQEALFRENYFDPIAQCFTNTAVFCLLESDWNAQ